MFRVESASLFYEFFPGPPAIIQEPPKATTGAAGNLARDEGHNLLPG